MALVHTIINKEETSIVEDGKMERNTGKVSIRGKMEINMKEIISMTSLMGKRL